MTICCPKESITFQPLRERCTTRHFTALLPIFDHRRRGPDFDLARGGTKRTNGGALTIRALVVREPFDKTPEITVLKGPQGYVITEEGKRKKQKTRKGLSRCLEMVCNVSALGSVEPILYEMRE